MQQQIIIITFSLFKLETNITAIVIAGNKWNLFDWYIKVGNIITGNSNFLRIETYF